MEKEYPSIVSGNSGIDENADPLTVAMMDDASHDLDATADKMSALRQYAAVLLTDKRLIVIPTKLTGMGLAGVITASIVNKMTSKDGVISVPLIEISGIRDGKFGLLVKALIVDIKGGEGELVKLTLPKREQWKQAIAQRCL